MLRFKTLLLFIWLSFAATTGYDFTPCDRSKGCFTSASSEELANISIRLYPNGTMSEFESVLVGNATKLLDLIHCKKRVTLYISGWSETSTSQSVKTVLNAYCKRDDSTILYLDYEHIAEMNYFYAVASVPSIAYFVARALNQMIKEGLDPSRIHIIGHSLGGQIARYIGMHLDSQIYRITALDPAGPLFGAYGPQLSRNNAKIVDVISTDQRGFGSSTFKGTVHFYPNGGSRVQPGCMLFRMPFGADDYCDHHRSWYYYAESVLKEAAFIGVKCQSYSNFKEGLCSSNETAVMGFATLTNTSGEFYLQTNAASPFGRGDSGLRYREQNFSLL